MTIILEVKNLKRNYRQGKTTIKALDGIDLAISKGEFVSIMGRSGSGKSTLLHLLGTLDYPTQGEIFLEEQNLTNLSKRNLPKIRRSKIGFVFQEYNLIPTLTALENVELPLKYGGINNRKEKSFEALKAVGLEHRINHRPNEMSGGEQQRVAIARAIVSNPSIILADEPTGEVDTHTAGEIVKLMKKLNKELGVTFVIVTHDPDVASQTDRTIFLSDGKIIKESR